METKMTKEQRELARLYIMAEVTKFCAENQHRFAQEIKSKYGFDPDSITEEGKPHDSNTAIGNSPTASPNTSTDETPAAAGESEIS